MRSFAAYGQGVRLNSKVNASELPINTVIKAGLKQRSKPRPKWYVAGCLFLIQGHVDVSATGGEAGPNLFLLLAWNWVSPYFRPRRPFARGQADRKKSRRECG